MKTARIVFGIVMILSTGLCAISLAQEPPPSVNGTPISQLNGADLFRAACITCHAVDGKGSPQAVVGFDAELPDFTDCRFSTPEPDSDWSAMIHNGGTVRAFSRTMPSFRDVLTDDQISGLIKYLRAFCDDNAWPRGDLNLPRPLNTEKAFPENEAVVTTSFSKGAGSVSNQFVFEHRIGRRGQYEITLPFNIQERESGGWDRGLGDAEISYKHVLFHSMRTGTIFSAAGELGFPTGKESQGLGEGRSMIAGFAAFGQILPHDGFIHFQSGLDHPLKKDTNDEAFWRAVTGKSFTQALGTGRAWTPMLEVLGAREMTSGAKPDWDVVPQIQVSLSKRQHILVNAGIRFPVNDRQERSKALMVYFLWDWFDGGLFSGWK
jgi:hypothetical protein